MDGKERAIEAAVADFREQLEAFEFPGEPAGPGLLGRAARAAGTLAANLGGLLAVLVVFGAVGAAVRFGWEIFG